MKFASPWWLLGTGLALVVAALLIVGGVLLVRDIRRFGDEHRVESLLTFRSGGRRAFKGVLLVLAVALAFAAMAGPEYGRGTRLIPATNLDVVIVLDYSKSMYARDVAPSRIARAKTEVSRLVADLPGARFGAVAFAGDPISFPLTSDGAAIAQFFRQLSPNDMPVGGTAIARALEAGRELLDRDPLSKNHRRVLLLVTDGEDLEGDPVSVARAASKDGTTIDVVQIGGRTPEPIPEVDEAGEVSGWRTDDDGKPLTTSLTAAGEAQLTKIAQETHGSIVRSERGSTGIREIAAQLRKLMTEELSERVETVYADVYYYPLGLAILLLVLETFVSEARRRKRVTPTPPPKRRPRRKRRETRAAALGLLLAFTLSGAGCQAVDSLFERNAPPVDQAIGLLDGGADAAVGLLEQYLRTGQCSAGGSYSTDNVASKHNAGFDLGLGLFALAEKFGQRFGEEEADAGAAQNPEDDECRKQEVACALSIVEAIAKDRQIPIDLRARALYLAGNLEFLSRDYQAAVDFYDRALKLIPGLPDDAGDGIGRDAAWNRAIALRRIEDEEKKKDAGQDSSPDAQPDAQPDAGDGGDGGKGDGGGKDSGSDGGDDSGQNQDQSPDAGGKDSGSGQDASPNDQGDAGTPPPPEPQRQPSVNQDERMLDMLERAPTLQQEAAKNQALQRRALRGMEDK